MIVRKKDISDKLVLFLKKNRVLRRFLNNTNSGSTWGNFSGFSSNFTIDKIGGGFLWKDSPEGMDFWGELSNKYNKSL